MEFFKKISTNYKFRILCCAVFTAVLLAVSWLVFGIHFETNDDYTIMSIIAGTLTGYPYPMPFVINYLFALPLAKLYSLFPTFPWYTIYICFIVWLSYFLILSCFIKTASDMRSLYVSLIVAACIYILAYLYTIVFLQFTMTASIAGTAAICIYITERDNESKNEKYLHRLLFAFILLNSLCIRWEIGIVSLLVLFSSFFVRLFLKNDNLKNIFVYIILSLIILSGVSYVSKVSLRSTDWQNFLKFSSECSRWNDYKHLDYDANKELYNSVGWDKSFYNLAEHWFFLDENYSYESLVKIYNANGTDYKCINFLYYNIKKIKPACWYSLLFFLCLIFLSFFQANDNSLKLRLVPFAYWTGTILLLFYLAYYGRMVDRVVYSFMIIGLTPASLFCLPLLVQAEMFKKRTILFKNLIIIILCCVVLLTGAGATAKRIIPKAKAHQWREERTEQLHNYALSVKQKGNVIVFDEPLLSHGNAGPFCLHPYDKPTNLIFWGYWHIFSPVYTAQLNINRYDSLTSKDFFDGRILMATVKDNYYSTDKSSLMGMMNAYMQKRYPECKQEKKFENKYFVVYQWIR